LARKILLADDSVTAQNMGRRILSDAGYDVTTVNNGSAALKKIAESKPDLIVLDVYMPGYGGLEVCQRLREAPETARIPVLLTVGKLEPFKADEARRVRADAFIVKPFEASELLTALTKLEDKIVPQQSAPSRQSRFAKALAGVEELNPSKEFGDSETGWKNRLSIPPPHSKHREPVPEEPSETVASLREAVRTEEPKPAEMKSGIEEALLSSMPQDVTAEEIAAIRAATAAFSAPGSESSFRQGRDQAEAPNQEPVAKAKEFSPEPAVSESISVVAQTDSSAGAEGATKNESVSPVDVPSETVPPSAIVAELSDSTTSQSGVAGTGTLADDEVTAALASLAPTNGDRDSTAEDKDRDKWGLGSREQVPVTMAVAGATQEFNGPRWIAESVAVMDDEALLALDHEMEKAYAAFAAADAARASFESLPADSNTSTPVAESPATNSDTASPTVESFPSSDSSESTPPEPAVQTSSESTAPEAEPSTEAASPVTNAVSEGVPQAMESAAYAAAASAGASSAEVPADATTMSQPSVVAEFSESAAASTEPGGRQGESELAAAWANWKQIRESVVGSQLSSQIADTVVELKETSSEAQAEPHEQAAAPTGEETSDIANIVDSVLADLKPKLMAEIARKMGKEKK
jgi:CheY-like chemotaxis protein